MSQKNINDICAKSANSASRDFASLLCSEDVSEIKQEAETSAETSAESLLSVPFDLKVTVEEVALTELDNRPHPMLKKVFFWINIDPPLELDEEDQHYDFIEDKQEDNASVDLSVRTQSPNTESSFLGTEVSHRVPSVSDKVPNHGYDISVAQVAQHKRVFMCPECSFWATAPYKFHMHYARHFNQKQFECSVCTRQAILSGDITRHIKTKSVADPAHECAKVLMIDETQRRNYSKYKKYLFVLDANTSDFPLVWVSKAGKFTKMYQCRYCPQVTVLKGSAKRHEKLHGIREKATAKGTKVEYHCAECNYVCKNANALSSHSKVHQALYGEILGLVDPTKTDEEQIRKFRRANNQSQDMDEIIDILENDAMSDSNESVIFKDRGGSEIENRLSPNLNMDVLQRLKNNEGEYNFVNCETVDFVEK